MHLRIGTRASELAQWQANWVAQQLRQGGASVEIVEITTSGDIEQSGPIAAMGQQGVFTKEIQAALLDTRVDVAVHSLKDLPTESVEGVMLAAVPEREDVADALITNQGLTLDKLSSGARIGTGSLRRQAQLKRLRADLEVVRIRGNVDTRLRKLDEGEYDAILLAVAGLYRLGRADRITERLAPPRMLPAVGQGALGIECLETNQVARSLLGPLDHWESRLSTTAERAMLALLHGGCSAPVGAWGRVENGTLLLDGLVANLAGTQVLQASSTGNPDDAQVIGEEVASRLLDQGAAEIIAATR